MVSGFTGEDAQRLVEDTAVLTLVRTRIECIVELVVFRKVYLDGGVEIYLKKVFPFLQDSLHVALPGAVHIVGVEYALMVEVDVGVCVEAFEDYLLVFGRDFIGSCGEGGLIHPVFLVDPLHRALVEAEERVFDDFIVHQVGVYCSRHGRRIPDVGPSLSEAPSVV